MTMTTEAAPGGRVMEQWQQRQITLIGDRSVVDRACSDWEGEHWRIVAVEPAEPTVAGHECHRVTVLVPKGEWASVLLEARAAAAS